MEEWKKISLILCTFGFLRDFRPSDPFLTEFLLGSWRNITNQELYQDVYPISTYAYMTQLVIAFLITDFLRYKPLIIVMGGSGIAIFSMLLWTKSTVLLQIEQIIVGTQLATNVAYFTYLYTKVDKMHYIKVTSYVRTARLLGKLFAGVFGQALIYAYLMDYRDLNYISLSTQILATVLAIFLPSTKTSLYFHREPEKHQKKEEYKPGIPDNRLENTRQAFTLLWKHFTNAYTNTMVVQWSFWYIVNICGFLQVTSYIQILWNSIDNNVEVVWNGVVEAILTFSGAVLSFLAGYAYTDKTSPRKIFLGISFLCIIEGFCLLLVSWATVLLWAYVGYVLFGALSVLMVTVSSSEVSRNLTEESFGLIFGFNTFAAIVVQTFLVILVVSKDGFALDAKGQFTVYAFYFFIVGLVNAIGLIIISVIESFKSDKALKSMS